MTGDPALSRNPEEFDPTAIDATIKKRRFKRRIILLIMLFIIGGIVYMMNPFRSFNAKADIAPSLLERGMIIHGTSGAVTDTEEFTLSVFGAGGYPWSLSAYFVVNSTSDDSIAGGGDLSLGEHLTVTGLGDFYLIE